MDILIDLREWDDALSDDSLLQGLVRHAAHEIECLRGEVESWKTTLANIEAALKTRGLFAFEHIDGTFSLNHR